jgi:hypothetical protein
MTQLVDTDRSKGAGSHLDPVTVLKGFDILAGGPGSPKDFDIDRYNRTQPGKLDGLSLDELFDRFRSVRRDTVALVEGMQDKDLDREGWHAFLGHGKLERFIVWAYEHARLHLADIRKILK